MWPSVVVFSRGRAVWSPWETETVEPAFGTYHFIQGEVGTNSTIKRLLFPLLFVWTLKLSFILDIHMIKTIIPSYIELMATFFKHETVVQSVTVGPRYGTGRFSLKSSVGQAPLCACLFSKNCSFDRPFSSFASGDHRSGEWERFQVSSFRVAGKKKCLWLRGLNPRRKC